MGGFFHSVPAPEPEPVVPDPEPEPEVIVPEPVTRGSAILSSSK
jgi:hypothetical protein